MDIKKYITIRGAREHNLKNITVALPKESLTVVTGPSGSGKSTLALDILYAEGQRRYIESLSSYARQFLGVPPRPDVDGIDGLCPAIAIDQKTVGANPRSTVGTITEIYDYIRVLFARIGVLHCPSCYGVITAESAQTIAPRLLTNFAGQEVTIAAPIVRERKGEFYNDLERLFLAGFYRFSIDGQVHIFKSLSALKELNLKKSHKHSIDVLIDKLMLSPEESPRLHEAIERAFALAQGLCKVITDTEQYSYSMQRMCIPCARSFPEIEPRLFSFNSPLGACKHCHGLGFTYVFDSETALYGPQKSVEELFNAPCQVCAGQRLNELALAVTVQGLNIYQVAEKSIKQALLFFQTLELTSFQQSVVERLLNEITARYGFLMDVGLGYLTLNRTARTLSGGESQRIRLATQIGSALSGVVYVLDEPSIGLHQRDNDRLIATLKKLRDQGNTVVVVEHDLDTMRHADYIFDMGPGAGVQGGMVIASGTPQELADNTLSLTGAYLSGARRLERQQPLRTATGVITIKNARRHNLKDLTVNFPLGVVCGISGVSGSGKSTLIMHELVPALKNALANRFSSVTSDKITGAQQLEALVVIDQTPIGRTPRSNPATYLGIFDDIRKLFASQPESNARGYTPGRFSFNVKDGRCAQCDGEGTLTISMHFLPDVTIICNSCNGLRYNAQTLEITYKNKNIAHVLVMTAAEAYSFFESHSALARRLKLLCDVGLEYIKLGQSSTTLSGGEAQRVKLVDELAKRGNKTLYILDEPTTGLHPHDIEKLLQVLNKLVNKGNSVLVIEHNIEVLATLDYLIDMGPEGGDTGGFVVAEGTPQEIAQSATSSTGSYLAKLAYI